MPKIGQLLATSPKHSNNSLGSSTPGNRKNRERLIRKERSTKMRRNNLKGITSTIIMSIKINITTRNNIIKGNIKNRLLRSSRSRANKR
jgi:hypothetical protein